MTDNQQFYQDFTSTYIDAANDFGFTAVDANELAQQTTQVTQNATTQVVSGVSDTIKTEIFALNTKINEIYIFSIIISIIQYLINIVSRTLNRFCDQSIILLYN